MQRIQLTAFSLVALFLALTAHADSAHEHGSARLDVAVDGDRLHIALQSPLDNLVGFEHAPRNERQRTALAKSFEDGEFAAEIAEFDAAWQDAHGHGRAAAGRIEQQIKAIVDDALPGKHVDVDDNLFEVGASSLTLIQIHEKIDELYPGLVDLTELFDFPTVSQLAKHLEQKLAAT